MEANSAARAGLSAHAREQYQWLLTAEPNNSDALLGLARLDSAQGDIESARASYIRLLELDPTDPIAQAGLLNLGADDVLGQEAELKALVSRYPNAAPLSFVLGNLLASQQRWKEAEVSYARALNTAKAVDASFVGPDYAFNLAVALEKLNKPDEAYLYYQEALQLSRQISPGFDLSLLNSRIAYLQGRL
jgi:tetratricopeptide (TPR) repeat protein